MSRHFKLNVNGTDFDVVVEEVSSSYSPVASAPAAYTPAPVVGAAAPVAVATPSAAPAPAGAGDQCAQMGGVVASIAVKEGQSVSQGQTIAYCGSTGNSTGPHCHFEVRRNGEPVSPYSYL